METNEKPPRPRAPYHITSIRFPIPLWNDITRLLQHIEDTTGKRIGFNALIKEAFHYYFKHLLELETDELIYKYVIEGKARRRRPRSDRKPIKPIDNSIDNTNEISSNIQNDKEKVRSTSKTESDS